MPARWIIHTVGPNRDAGETDPALLRSCFTESLRAAELLGARSIAFPAISAGVYGWTMADVARIGLDALSSYAGPIPLARVVLFSEDALAVWREPRQQRWALPRQLRSRRHGSTNCCARAKPVTPAHTVLSAVGC